MHQELAGNGNHLAGNIMQQHAVSVCSTNNKIYVFIVHIQQCNARSGKEEEFNFTMHEDMFLKMYVNRG